MSVIIGMDPHKSSATIEVVDEHGKIEAVGRYGTDKAGYGEMLKAGRKFDERIWAIEGCNGIGKHISHRLVHDGESVVDVSPKLSAQVRVFATGNGRKTDPVDAHSIAMVALRSPNLRAHFAEREEARGVKAGARDAFENHQGRPGDHLPTVERGPELLLRPVPRLVLSVGSRAQRFNT